MIDLPATAKQKDGHKQANFDQLRCKRVEEGYNKTNGAVFKHVPNDNRVIDGCNDADDDQDLQKNINMSNMVCSTVLWLAILNYEIETEKR